jgi:hypothetical protein
MERVKVIISPDGKMEVEVNGVKGRECLSITEFLGKEPGKRILTGEYYLQTEKLTNGLKLPTNRLFDTISEND